MVGLGYICYITFCHAVERFGSRRGGTRRAELLAAELTSRSSLAGMPSPERTHARPHLLQCPTFTGMADFRESTGHTLTIKSGLPYHIPYHFRALKRPCPAVSNHVQPCPTMSGHVWTQVDMLIDPASGLKKSNWFAYHFRIPLYHTSAKRIRKGPNTSMIPVNLQHWLGSWVCVGGWSPLGG